MKYKFKKDFYWGSATAGGQIEESTLEGGRSETVWDHWFKMSPERFYGFNNVRNNFYEKYNEDLDIAKNLNFNSLRISIQWARVMPDGETINPEGIKFYHKIIDKMIKNKLKVFVCIHHFDMPMWAQEKGGWLSREVVDKFEKYAIAMFKEYGSKVDYWFTFNEPLVPLLGGYLFDFHFPNRFSMKEYSQASWNLMIAHKKVVRAFRKLNMPTKIGMIVNINPSIPRNSENEEDVKAAELSDIFHWRAMLDWVIKNETNSTYAALAKKYDFVWDEEDEDKELLANYKIDYLGTNYYSPSRVKAIDYVGLEFNMKVFTPHLLVDRYQMPNARMNKSRGWEINPKSIYDMLIAIKTEYDNILCFISENGMGIQGENKFRDANGIINDQYRIDFIEEHLHWVGKAIEEGVNCNGYHMWTYIDNWSWSNAYKNRYGFIELDLKTGKRIPKKSAAWIKKTISNNYVDWKGFKPSDEN